MPPQPESRECPHDLPSLAYRSWFLFLMVLVSASVIAERYMMGVLVEPIRHDLHLSDTQIGIANDLAIAIVYIIAVVPLARVADRWSKRNVVAAAAVVWSAAVLICGSARNFAMLLVGRSGIGLGEGGFTPSSQAWIADLFPPRQRATALAIFLLGASFGSFAGPTFGGWAAHAYGWRTAMMLASIPGFILAPIVWFTLRDSRPGLSDGYVQDTASYAGILETARSILKLRTLPLLMLAAGMNALTTTGLISWAPAFMQRTHGMSMQQVGLQMGGTLLAGSVLGHTIGGPLVDMLGRRNLRWYIWLPMIAGAASSIVGWFTLTGPAATVFPLFGLQVALGGVSAAPMLAVVAGLAPLRARATAVALLMVVIQVIGLGGGPNLIGMLSDLLHPTYGEASLGIAMRWSLIVGIPSTILLAFASRHYVADHATARAELAATTLPLDQTPLPVS